MKFSTLILILTLCSSASVNHLAQSVNNDLAGTITIEETALTSDKGNLVVEINRIKTKKGLLCWAVYNREDHFLVGGQNHKSDCVEIQNIPSTTFQIEELEFGTYSLALFHDSDYDRQMASNWIGVPKDAFGFSNNKVYKWRKPEFKECNISFTQDRQKIEIDLYNWGEL